MVTEDQGTNAIMKYMYAMQFPRTFVFRVLLFIVLILVILSIPLLIFFYQRHQQRAASVPNPIQLENQLPGTDLWQLTNIASYDEQTYRFPDIEGYAWTASALPGDTVSFSVSTTSASFQADIYRLGWYQGQGGRLKKSISNLPGQFCPMPPMDPQTGLVDANWPVTFKLYIDPAWVTGIYIVKLTAANGKQGYIPFTVRAQQPAAFLFVHSDNTDQAYNPWGGKSLYEFNSLNGQRAYKVSYNRPLADDEVDGSGNLFYWEYSMIRYLEKQGYDLSYVSNVDTFTDPTAFTHHKGILIVGHSEYWAKEMRDHLEYAINQGVNLANFAANSIYWQIRYESSKANLLPNRIMVCYKDATLDPLSGKDKSHVTVEFREPPLNRPEQSLFGSMSNTFFHNPGFPWVVKDSTDWILQGTGLKNGDSLPGLVGYEYDSLLPGFPAPPGDKVISSSPIVDYQEKHFSSNSTEYITRKNSRIVNMGTMQWSWGLDDYGSKVWGSSSVVNWRAQKITDNILQSFLL